MQEYILEQYLISKGILLNRTSTSNDKELLFELCIMPLPDVLWLAPPSAIAILWSHTRKGWGPLEKHTQFLILD